MSAVPATADNLIALGIGIDVEDGGDTCIQTARIPAGRCLGQHAHEHSHQSVLVSGRIRLWVDGVVDTHEGFKLFTIEAGRKHMVEAVTDAVWLCVWSLSKADRAAIDASVTEE